MGKELNENQQNEKKKKTPKWYNDKSLFAYHFGQSNYVTALWNWFMGLASKAAEPFLFASVLYSGYKLLPGVPQPAAGFDAAMFIMQQATLDIGGMGLMKLASQAKKPKGSFPYVVGIILVGLMILSVAISSIERLIPLGTAGTVIEGILLIARAVMAVLYGHAIHGLKEEGHPVTGVVKTTDIYDWLAKQQEKVDNLDGKVDSLSAAHGTLSSQLATTNTSLSTQFTAVGATLSSLTTTLSSLAEKLVEVDSQITAVDSHLAQVEETQGSRFQQFQTTLTEVREVELTPLARQVGTIGQAVMTLGTALAEYDSRLGEVDNRLTLVEESQGSRFNELHTSLRAIVVEVRQATANELVRGLSPLAPLVESVQAGALLPAPSSRAGSNGEGQKNNGTKKMIAAPRTNTNQQEDGEKGPAQGTRKGTAQGNVTRRLDTLGDHSLDTLILEELDTQVDREGEEGDQQLDTLQLDRGEGGKIITLSSGSRLDTRTKQADITAYILEFVHREDREPSISEIMNGAGCAKQTAINARNAAREILQREQGESDETSQAVSS